MTTKSLAEMTVEELKELITQVVDQRLINSKHPSKLVDKQRLQEIFAAIDRHIIVPLPGEPTGSEMIIEERNQWRQGM